MAAAGLITAGLLAVNRPPTSFGWFAYAPLSDTTHIPGASPATLTLTALGMALLILGLLSTGLLAGMRIRRRGRDSPLPQDRGDTETQ